MKFRLGNGAIVSCKASMLHPRKVVREKYTNDYNTRRVHGLVAVSLSRKKTDQIERVCVILTHPDFPEVELYSTVRMIKVDKEGPAAQMYSDEMLRTGDMGLH